jgi:uncharacterized protein YerC
VIIKVFMTDLCHFHSHCLHMIMKVSQIKTLKKCYHIISADRVSIAVTVHHVARCAKHTVHSSDSS